MMYGMGGSQLKQRIAAVLDVVGLTERSKEKVETYSGGMKRRINIAVGLLHQPKVLYMDEPTVGIDPQSRRRILDTVLDLNAQGLTLLYTTHNMEEAAELSDRIGIIDNGKLIALGTQAELTKTVGEFDTMHIGVEAGKLDAAALLKTIEAARGVHRASLEDGSLIVQSEDANDSLADVVSRMDKAGAKVLSLKVEEPNLEAVFLHLTGRALRD